MIEKEPLNEQDKDELENIADVNLLTAVLIFFVFFLLLVMMPKTNFDYKAGLTIISVIVMIGRVFLPFWTATIGQEKGEKYILTGKIIERETIYSKRTTTYRLYIETDTLTRTYSFDVNLREYNRVKERDNVRVHFLPKGNIVLKIENLFTNA